MCNLYLNHNDICLLLGFIFEFSGEKLRILMLHLGEVLSKTFLSNLQRVDVTIAIIPWLWLFL